MLRFSPLRAASTSIRSLGYCPSATAGYSPSGDWDQGAAQLRAFCNSDFLLWALSPWMDFSVQAWMSLLSHGGLFSSSGPHFLLSFSSPQALILFSRRQLHSAGVNLKKSLLFIAQYDCFFQIHNCWLQFFCPRIKSARFIPSSPAIDEEASIPFTYPTSQPFDIGIIRIV